MVLDVLDYLQYVTPVCCLLSAASCRKRCVEKGYDGLEVSADDMRKRFWPSQSLDWVARETRALCDKYDLEATGKRRGGSA